MTEPQLRDEVVDLRAAQMLNPAYVLTDAQKSLSSITAEEQRVALALAGDDLQDLTGALLPQRPEDPDARSGPCDAALP